MEFWIGIAAGVFTSVSLLPQVFKLIKEKRAESISLPYLLILLIGLCLWITYGILENDLPIIFSNAFAMLTTTVTLVLGFLYKKQA